MTRPDANEPKRTSKDTAPTAEYPAYARGSAPPHDRDPHDRGADWPGEADDIGAPMDTGRFRDSTRMELAEPRRGGGWRGLLWLAAVIALVGAVLFGVRSVGLWPDFNNPFAEKQTDRSQPVLLKSIQDLSRFTAASGNFEVVIDVQSNRNLIPDFIYNERTLFVAAGSVDAYVDFARVTEDGLKVDQEAKTVEVRLPAAQLEKPNINNERSYVFATQRGLVNRIGDLFGGDPNKQRQLYVAAETKIGEAAKGSGLVERAQENTTKMLDQMLRALGYTTIKITYAAP